MKEIVMIVMIGKEDSREKGGIVKKVMTEKELIKKEGRKRKMRNERRG